ncbi:glycosyltransferase [Pontibacter oryzae]|uniref:Glycosyltransferase n=1 Tax=Pontibacter oryzae TaxID=2304593 RepID=A0A399SFR2_9BACT|nr:glycosyltransferase [Pontibacter oryzae]RIJ41981.1 glycosyltransferase [Pontibacter oryzae]
MVTSLSILIPVFNQDVTAMVHTLLAQCIRLSISYEIRIYDDASEDQFRQLNRPLAGQAGVVYEELPNNIGRSSIRNRLAFDAQYEHLLFLDNDCLPVSFNFLFNYLVEAQLSEVVIGGVAYVATKPEKPFRLHWKYGRLRGAKSATQRQQQPYNDVFLCNALIKRAVFYKFPLRESLKKYGHEDTVFAQHLQENNISVKHINNPVVHLGLEETTVLLLKTEQAVQNLAQLYAEGEQVEPIRIMQAYNMLQNWRLARPYQLVFATIERVVKQNLASGYPNLMLYDLYRLFLLSKLLQNKKG